VRIVTNSYCEELFVLFFWGRTTRCEPSHTGSPAWRRLRSLLSPGAKSLRPCVRHNLKRGHFSNESKNPSAMIPPCFSAKQFFGVLGALHASYTVLDLRHPRRLAPVDPAVAEAMAHSAVRVPRGNGHVASLDLALAFVSHDGL